jgi:hypothetical protein
MAHTPGPWVAQVDPLGGSKRYGPRMAMVATTAGDGSVCIDCTGSGKDFSESAANARLISAAPELLEALRECSIRLDACRMVIADPDAREMVRESVSTARAAIAKATS